MRHLEIGRENRRAERDGVARVQQSIGLQRFEDVAHRGGAAFDRIEIEFAGGPRLAAHRPHQILVHDPLVVDQHAVGHRIVVADDRIDELVHECIRLEAECLHREGDHRGEEAGARHLRMFFEPGIEPDRDALRLRHAAEAGGMLHHALALGDRELTEQEKAFARRRGDPIRIAAAGIEECRLRRPRRLLGELDQLVLDFERTQSLEFAQCEDVSHDVLQF